jgi:anti-sigma factor RsiW
MACPEFEDLIFDYCEGAASPAEIARLEAHVAACGDCRAFLETQQELERRLSRSLPQPAVSAAFGNRLAAEIARQRYAPRFRRLPLVLDWIGYLSLAYAASRLIEQVPHAGVWISLAGGAGAAVFSLWETGKALRSSYGHR